MKSKMPVVICVDTSRNMMARDSHGKNKILLVKENILSFLRNLNNIP